MKSNSRTSKELISDKLYYLIRIGILLSVILLFIPNINPARISSMINKNLSLFTSGLSYSSLIAEFSRALKRGWVEAASMQLLYGSSLTACLGVAITGAGGCMSLGNMRFKKLGNVFAGIGALVEVAGMIGIYSAYSQISLTSNPDKIQPMLQNGYWAVLLISMLVFLLTAAQFILLHSSTREANYEMPSKFKLFLLMMPFVALGFVFSYLPLWGWRYAFFDYKAGDTISMEKFVAFKWFTELFRNQATVKDIIRVLKNTLAMSGLGILTSWLPMVFAIFLSEIKSTRVKRFVQTFTTIPNFISWVLVYAIAFCLFSTDGFISSLFVNTGIWKEGVNMLMGGENIWIKMWAWGMWKGIGWSAIIYIAAISGIDQQLYEAATVDGAGRFQRMWHITVPGLIPTFCVLLLMAVANILSNGMDQYLVFENATNTSSVMVLDLYVYKLGIGKGMIPLSTVIGMVKSIVSVTLLFGANKISKIIRGESIV